jgi:hypothetical protein
MKAKGSQGVRLLSKRHILTGFFSLPGHFCDIKNLVIFSNLKKKVVEFSLEFFFLQRRIKFLS